MVIESEQRKILNFKGSWRSYQKRILDNLNWHLRDEKLHIVAAPGAGKTTLGIEVISRLNRPTVILCPTNTIKNQWKERICSSFLDEKDYGLVSTNIREPKYITVITYQALLAAFCGDNDNEDDHKYSENEDEIEEVDENSITSSKRFKEENADEIIKTLKDAKVSLLCFDEAHHLRKEWWKALMYLNDNLKPEQTLALTATPPYDANYGEWKRYEELCGEIDEVISIPELVKNGDLCPHQDFIYFSYLKKNEKELLNKYSKNVKEFIEIIKKDNDLLKFLSNMKFFDGGDSDVEQIFENPDFYVSISSLLNSCGYKIPKTFLNLFNASVHEIPKFDIQRASIFLDGLFNPKYDDFKPLEEKKIQYFNMAKHMGLVANKKITLNENIKVRRQIASSLGKLDSIVDIVRIESEQLGNKLRMVILTDLIKADDMECSSMGVVPIWRILKGTFKDKISLGVLCGSLILLPKDKTDELQKLLFDNNIPQDSITIGNFKDENEYIKVTPKESIKNQIVKLITDMFNCGDLTVLVGTQALLGEGWDAPSINSLILSSTVSSYMLSNQMRGRAIRIDKNNPDKVSNIWHLATIDFPQALTENKIFTETISDNDIENFKIYYYDLEQLTTRFEGYEAPSYYDKHEIISGIDRVINNANAPLKQKISELKQKTVELAKNREQTRQWWKDSLYLGYGNNKLMSLSTGVETEPMTIKTLKYTSYKEIVYTFLTFVLWVYISLFQYALTPEIMGGITILAITVAGVFVGIMFKRFLKTGTVAGVMKQIAIVVLETLSYQGIIKASLKNIGLTVQKCAEGQIYVSCTNLPADENNIFIKAIQEFLDPVENPRYILIKHDKFLNYVKQTDYFSIPTIISPNKDCVKIFQSLWEEYIGDCEIVYTRNLEGRKVLLKARKDAFSSSKRRKSKKLSKWQ